VANPPRASQRADEGLLLAVDTASDVAGVAVMEDERLLGEVTWYAHQSHSRQLLPAIDWLLGHVGREKTEISRVGVCLGPGSYAGMRVGISTAKALAFGLGVSLTGIGRLAADALPIAETTGGRVVAIQAAGRAELAFAAYELENSSREPPPRTQGGGATRGELVERIEPHLGSHDVFLRSLRPGDAIAGDIDRLNETIAAAIEAAGCRLVANETPRVISIAHLARRRFIVGQVDNPDTLVPLYLRAPAIGPQTPR
jgi:tRNA threonylcarbamoyladenosine biosynthesis protein TsaB